jgi:formylglycine-generating enzyme required for sulfatase activity
LPSFRAEPLLALARHSERSEELRQGWSEGNVRTLKAQFFSFQFFSFFIYPLKTNKIMKKSLLSLFSLLLLFAAATTATAQEPKPKLAVLVVGMDDWMLGDVLAHLVGEEINRGNTYDVITRRNDVQNKLKTLRRGTEKLHDGLLRTWADAQGIDNLCLVTTTPGLNFSLRLLDVSSGSVQCTGSRIEPNAVSLKQLAWSLAGGIGDVCAPSGSIIGDYTELLEVVAGLEMLYVEGGEFRMGCAGARDGGTNGHISVANNGECFAREEPDHDVTVGNFWIGKYEVTQAQWALVMGTSTNQQQQVNGSSYGVGPNYPMYYVSWEEAQAFCDTLSARTGWSYRLPTEEEWEYAARGGKLSAGDKYSGGNGIGSAAWYTGTASGATHAVGGKSENELGIYDMSGNVYEWCSNKWRGNYNTEEVSSSRVVRGGSSWDDAVNCRVASRYYYDPSFRGSNVGFRVV